MSENALEQYDKAVIRGRLRYYSRIARGKSGYLLSMEDQFPQMEVTFEEDLGLETVPLRKIRGTWSRSRARMFTAGFLPITISDKSEFSQKWMNLYDIHMTEGIRDPVKLYEYLNWYYVIEGNKRVSVLSFVGAGAIEARVIRLLPRREPMTPVKRVYFPFIGFKSETGISEIWLKNNPEGYAYLLDYINELEVPVESLSQDSSEFFLKEIYRPFRQLYQSLGANRKLRMTTGDAFLRFLKIFQISNPSDFSDMKKPLLRLIDELAEEETSEDPELNTDEIERDQVAVTPFFSSPYSSKKPLKAVFLYARSLQTSGWSYAHEQGRLAAQEALGERIDTLGISDVPENDDSFSTLEDVVKLGADIVFTTSPYFANATLKAAMEYPKILFYNCSSGRSYKRMRTYFGQSYESSFLLGLMAALIDRENRIGYIATTTGLEKYSRINGFVRGIKQINPHGGIKLKWNQYWDYPAHSRKLARELLDEDCNIIFQHSLPKPGNTTGEYGLYNFSRETGEEKINHYGHTLWNWGNFYTSVLRNRLSGSSGGFKNSDVKGGHYQFWGGLRTGIVDLIMNKDLIPPETIRLIELLKGSLIRQYIHPFEGPVADNKGQIRIPEGQIAGLDEIRSMDWLCKGVQEL